VFTYDAGSVVDLVAMPDTDYSFVEWTGDIGSVGDPFSASTSITMNGDVSVTATFEEDGGDEEIDVNQSLFNRGFPIRHAADGDWAGAQSFVPTVDMLSSVDIYIRASSRIGFNLTVELRENNVSGNLIDSKSYSPDEIPNSWSWFNVDFEDISVSPGEKYFIILPPEPNFDKDVFGYEWGYAFGDQYPDGSFWFTRDGGGLWRDLPDNYEFSFKTYGIE
ncbi:MAG TPA: hypothetical protein VKP59_01375, partial [Candidatus Thermoplasmatota archaeon]|nr:hypothetical protein [Candidatus Thermoplasmatota archaeon]